jgi:hypothetical protein
MGVGAGHGVDGAAVSGCNLMREGVCGWVWRKGWRSNLRKLGF